MTVVVCMLAGVIMPRPIRGVQLGSNEVGQVRGVEPHTYTSQCCFSFQVLIFLVEIFLTMYFDGATEANLAELKRRIILFELL